MLDRVTRVVHLLHRHNVSLLVMPASPFVVFHTDRPQSLGCKQPDLCIQTRELG